MNNKILALPPSKGEVLRNTFIKVKKFLNENKDVQILVMRRCDND